MPCDVKCPLLGPNGAAYVFGTQKGAKNTDELERLDKGVEHITRVLLKGKHGDQYSEDIFQRVTNVPGTGAAGGFVGAMIALFGDNAKTVSGMDFVSELTDLEKKVQDNDLIITGEGSFDDQTLQGKAVA